MFLKIFAIFLFSGGFILLLFGNFAMNTMSEFGIYIFFFGMVLWCVGTIFIIASRGGTGKNG